MTKLKENEPNESDSIKKNLNESVPRRKAREEAYRVQVERERKENIWTESEAKLWSEMSASLE